MTTIMIGLDLAKNVFQLHGVDCTGKVTLRRRLRRSEVEPFFATLAPCVVGMKRAAGRIIGAAPCGASGTRCG